MGLFSYFNKLVIRQGLAQMASDSKVIQMGICLKISPNYVRKYGRDRGLTIAAAIANKLVGKVSPSHSHEDLHLAEQEAADIFKSDPEIRYAALMACRAILLIETEKNPSSQPTQKIWDTIQWMDSLHELSQDIATPGLIREIAENFHTKYVNQK
jgi:hypothetical protein